MQSLATRCEVREGAIVRGPRDQKRIALVFTGHEFAEGARTILHELTRYRARAAFFLTGVFLAKPEFRPIVREIVRQGHYLGPHSDQHLLYCPWQGPKSTLLSQADFNADFAENLKKIANFTAAAPQVAFFLPPFEHYNQQIVYWASGFGHITVNYTPGTRSNADYTGESDHNFVSSDAIFDSILAHEKNEPDGLNGFILLLHLGAGPARADKFHTRFGVLLDSLNSRGYEFVALHELLSD